MAAFECAEPAVISDIATRDTNRLVGSIAKTLAANAPYLNVVGGGTFASGISDEQRTSVQMQAAPGDSLAIPTFVCETDLCGTLGHQDLTDTIEFTTRLEGFRGRGPNICVKKGYSAFRGSYLLAEDSMRKLITQYINADVRAQLYLRSASKFVANANYDFDSLFTGGSESDLGVKFADSLLPTGPMSFTALSYLAEHMRETLFAEWFSSDKGMPHFRFIGSQAMVNAFREEAGVKESMQFLTSGGYKMGEQTLTGYSFEQSPAYKGIAMGVDQRPLRFNTYNVDGTPALIDPVTIIPNVAKGTAYAVANPTWLRASYELGAFMGAGSFERLVPEKYVGEGSFKFSPQLHMGELEWHYIKDNGCNQWGDYGWHKYQISRAYRPLRPQHIVYIAYRRPCTNLGLVNAECPVTSSISTSDSFVDITVCEEDRELLPT